MFVCIKDCELTREKEREGQFLFFDTELTINATTIISYQSKQGSKEIYNFTMRSLEPYLFFIEK